MAVVVDANLLVALATADPRRPAVAARFGVWRESEEALHAPSLIRYEIASALTGLLAARQITEDQLSAGWLRIMALPITLHDLIEGPEVVRIAMRLGRRSAYDAAYIALATELGGDLWTLDGPLARNAGSAGLRVRLVGTAQPAPAERDDAT